ncbi:hypothetical protein [Micromonospora psammae]|uniref:hypothetical protein n=1 Tax=Micromonospora sp. CPCC 205556 TaxID=3122398 RepID=UPI002FEF5E3A
MRLTVFGATGGTGRFLVAQAGAGHLPGPAQPLLRVVRADVCEPAQLRSALAAGGGATATGPFCGRRT